MMGAEFADAAGEDVGKAGKASGRRAAGLGVKAGRRAGLQNLAFVEKNQMIGLKSHCWGEGGHDNRAA